MPSINVLPISQTREASEIRYVLEEVLTFASDVGLVVIGGASAESSIALCTLNILAASLGTGLGTWTGIQRGAAREHTPLSKYAIEMVPGFGLLKIAGKFQEMEAIQVPSIAGAILFLTRGFVDNSIQIQIKKLSIREQQKAVENQRIIIAEWVLGRVVGMATAGALVGIGATGIVPASIAGFYATRITRAAIRTFARWI